MKTVLDGLHLFRGRVLGDGLGAFRDGVLGEFTRQQEADSRLYLATRNGGLLVVVSQARRFEGDTLEDVVDERVHDGHSLARDAGVGVDLLEDLVDVDVVRFTSAMTLLLVSGGLGLGSLLRTLRCHFTRNLGRHAC